MRTLRAQAWIVVLGLVGCRCEARHEPAAPTKITQAEPSREVREPLSLGRIVGPAAFDIAASSDGLLIAWADRAACAGSLHVQHLDAEGRALEAEPRVDAAACVGTDLKPDAQVAELVIASEGGRLGIVWIAQDDRGAQAFGTYGADDAAALAPTLMLGAADATHAITRGRLALNAAQTGQMRVSYRAPIAKCVGEQGTCTQLITQPFPPPNAVAGRATDTREIKEPCPSMLAGAQFTSGIWYDAFCALMPDDDGNPVALTQVYAIRPEISYAEAIPVLRGCEPLGMSPAPKGVVIWGRCGADLRAHAIALGSGERVIEHASRSASCVQGRPVLHVSGDGQAFDLALDEPRSRLELLLPPELAPEGARAAFTGRRLIVAEAHDGTLRARAYRCLGDELVPEAGPLL